MVQQMSHLGPNTPKLFTLCTLTSYESLHKLLPTIKKSFSEGSANLWVIRQAFTSLTLHPLKNSTEVLLKKLALSVHGKGKGLC